jgi:asparagine synthase (glutamine-hydrolysing)
MCGLIGGALPPHLIEEALSSIAHRGPDAQAADTAGVFTLGHTRLAIQDLTPASGQPWTTGNGTVVTYNGEAWRPDDLRALLPAHPWATTGDTEPVAELLSSFGVKTLPLLGRAMFALAWVSASSGRLHLARDRFGEVPLHMGRVKGNGIVYASEVAPLLALGAHPSTVAWVPPGHVLTVEADGCTATLARWAPVEDLTPLPLSLAGDAPEQVCSRLADGVVDRLTSDAPVAVLASGGLDSSAVIGLARSLRPDVPLIAYTAVHDSRSADLKHARAICQRWGLQLREIHVPAPTAGDLADTVRAIEMPHKAQVEIAWACLHLARALQEDGRRVVLSGEGSDELWASYGMSYHGIKAKGWHAFRAETFLGQHRKNFARTNKVFMRHGVEARLPFLDPGLVEYALRLPQSAVVQAAGRTHCKAVLAAAVADLVPDVTAWRAKVAFQTGAKLDVAAARAAGDPRALYASVHRTHCQGVRV